MAFWGRPKCPVRPVEQEWIDTSLDWLRVQFGRLPLFGPVVLPDDTFFPGVYRGERADVAAVVDRLCAHMGIDRDTVILEHHAADDEPNLAAFLPVAYRSEGAAGHHVIRDGRSVISIRDDQAAAPMALVATIAHELGHVRLHGPGGPAGDRQDGEPLTDLATVYFGLGIFGANSVLDHTVDAGGYRTSRLGYLTEPMFGYALARYAWLRDEKDPSWARFLDTNPRAFMKRGLRYLDAR